VVNSEDVGKFTIFDGFDGLITNEPGISLATFHADCMAIYMIDPKKKVVGLAHAGWRGTVKNIAGKLAEKFLSEFGSSKEDIICALGPSIGQCCFEVSEDVAEKFRELGLIENYINAENKIDLGMVNKNLLLRFGLKEENIFLSDVCTMCNKDLLFSHRATAGKRGANAAFISII
jgi:YfiH family protein